MRPPSLLPSPESEFVPPIPDHVEREVLPIAEYNVLVAQYHVAQRFRELLAALPPDAAARRTILRHMDDVSAMQRRLFGTFHALQPHHGFTEGFRWKLLLEEALGNGVRKRDAAGAPLNLSLKLDRDFGGDWVAYQEATSQDAELTYGVADVDGGPALVSYLRDPGAGFNPYLVADNRLEKNRESGNGRGILLIAEFAKELDMRVLYFPRVPVTDPYAVNSSEMYWELPLKGTTDKAAAMFGVWNGIYERVEEAQRVIVASGPESGDGLLAAVNKDLARMDEDVRHAVVGGLQGSVCESPFALADGRNAQFVAEGDDALRIEVKDA